MSLVFIYPLKTLENLCFSDVFREYRRGVQWIEWEAEITGGGVGKWVKNKRKVWNKLGKFTQFQS